MTFALVIDSINNEAGQTGKASGYLTTSFKRFPLILTSLPSLQIQLVFSYCPQFSLPGRKKCGHPIHTKLLVI